MLNDLQVKPRPQPLAHFFHLLPVCQLAYVLVDKSEVEEDQDQEAVLEVLASPDKEVVLDREPCEEEEVVVKIPEKVVELFFHVLLALLLVLLEHQLPLLLRDLQLVVGYDLSLTQC